MNPLDSAGAWARYDLDSVRGAFNCAYLLPAIATAKPAVSLRWANKRGQSFGLLRRAGHGNTALAVVPVDGTGIDWGSWRTVAGQKWVRLQRRNIVAWAPAAYIGEQS